ncbi:FecR family protein [Pseudoflavitalea rhizosphaerae]|uniref:FecR family protein n=1 Tax=Pseudoflavitalea rhizosphaerae TaxID=1884793 RepID=UPI000F8C690C|nr:FecR family protein [Pseudoflavitalea rhizosphaerae]
MADKEFEDLFRTYLADTMTPAEFLRWKHMMQDDAYSPELEAQLEELVNADQSSAGIDAPVEKMYRHIAAGGFPQHGKPLLMRSYVRWVAAAAVLLLAGVAIFVLFLDNGKKHSVPVEQVIAESLDMLPGSNGAVLTLANGKKVVLDSMKNGVISLESNGKAVLENGALKYEADGAAAGEMQFNTITTAKGRQFQVRLPDGSKAWLNAASSLTYPTRFSGEERNVKVNGEVYFEVAKQKNKPFKVIAPDQSFIEVTGTTFNVNAYHDEAAITTTLTEGAVNIHAGNSYRAIRPGQQAAVKAGQINVIDGADTSQVLAWKNGVFDLNNAELTTVMRQLARWYDVNVEYEKQPPVRFGGKMQRNLKLSQVLNGLSGMGVQFRIEEGRKLVVY